MRPSALSALLLVAVAALAAVPSVLAEGVPRMLLCAGNDDLNQAVCLEDPVPTGSGAELCTGAALDQEACLQGPSPTTSGPGGSGRTLVCAGNGGTDESVCLADPLPA